MDLLGDLALEQNLQFSTTDRPEASTSSNYNDQSWLGPLTSLAGQPGLAGEQLEFPVQPLQIARECNDAIAAPVQVEIADASVRDSDMDGEDYNDDQPPLQVQWQQPEQTGDPQGGGVLPPPYMDYDEGYVTADQEGYYDAEQTYHYYDQQQTYDETRRDLYTGPEQPAPLDLYAEAPLQSPNDGASWDQGTGLTNENFQQGRAIVLLQLLMGQAGEQLGEQTNRVELLDQKLAFVLESGETLRGELQGHQFEFSQLKDLSRETSRHIGALTGQLQDLQSQLQGAREMGASQQERLGVLWGEVEKEKILWV
jgi:hypothetical protein